MTIGATNGNSITTRHEKTRSPFLKADCSQDPAGADPEDTKIHSALWHALRSWSLVIFAKFRSPMLLEVVRTVATSAWPHSDPELCLLTLFSLSCPLQPTEASRLDGAMWKMGHETILWQRQHQRTKDAQNDKSRSSPTRVFGPSGTPSTGTPIKYRFSKLAPRLFAEQVVKKSRLQLLQPPTVAERVEEFTLFCTAASSNGALPTLSGLSERNEKSRASRRRTQHERNHAAKDNGVLRIRRLRLKAANRHFSSTELFDDLSVCSVRK